MFEDNNLTKKYDKFTHHTIIHEIHLACCLGCRILSKIFGYAENVNTISGCFIHKYDTDILQ